MKRTRTIGLLKEIYPGRRFDSLADDELRVYRQEWARRNQDKIAARKVGRRDRDRARRRILATDPTFLEKKRAYERAWRARNKPKEAGYYRKYRLRAEYGLTLEEYSVLSIAQGHKCALCRRPDSGRAKWKGLVVDHDHHTRRVRALLCHQCNMVLGHANDNAALLRRMADYIELHRRKARNDGQAEQLQISA